MKHIPWIVVCAVGASSAGGEELHWEARVKVASAAPMGLVAYAPDGRYFAAAFAEKVEIHGIRHAHPLHTLRTGTRPTAIALSQDAHVACGHLDGTLTIWDFRDGVKTHVLPASNTRITAVTFLGRHDEIGWADRHGRVGLWGEHVGTTELAGHEGMVHSLRLAQSGDALVSTGADGLARVWDLGTRTLRAQVSVPDGGALDADLAPDGRSVVITGRRAWGVVGLPAQEAFMDSGTFAFDAKVRFSRDGRHVARTGGRLTEIRRATDGRPLASLGTEVAKAIYLGDGLSLSLVTGTTIHRWAWAYQQAEQPFTDGLRVRFLSFCQDGDLLVGAGRSALRAWRPEGLRVHWDLLIDGKVSSMACGPSDMLVVGSATSTRSTGAVLLVDAATGAWRQIATSEANISASAISADGSLIASGSQSGQVYLWGPDGQSLGEVTAAPPVVQVAFDPEVHYLASYSGDRVVRVWSVPDLLPVMEWEDPGRMHRLDFVTRDLPSVHGDTRELGPSLRVAALPGVIDRDHRVLAWPGRAGGVSLRDFLTTDTWARLQHPDDVTAVALSPDGGSLAVGDASGGVHLWEAGTPATVETSVARGDLSEATSLSRPPALSVHPNPSNSSVQIVIEAREVASLRVTIFDIIGQKIRHLADGPHLGGELRLHWDGTDEMGRLVASGVYVIGAATQADRAYTRMVWMR